MNIILDIDGTLIDENMNLRPYLDSFLLFCFSNFATVSIWTAGAAYYAFEIIRMIQPILDAVSYALQRTCSFFSVMTNIHCVLRNNIVTKPLQLLGGNFTFGNTIIIDDTPSTFASNPFNGVCIPKFISNDQSDLYLMMIQVYLLELIGGYRVFQTITYLNRSAQPWYMDLARLTFAKNAVVNYMPLTIPMDLSD